MITFPNCKINLGLHVMRKRPDGYHDLETVFFPVPGLKDALEAVPAASGKTTLHLSGIAVPGDEQNNLVWKARQLLEMRYGNRMMPLDLYLCKAIPMGAGLGGGSADGAFALRLISDVCGLGLGNEELAGLALELGSDCPFFIYNTPQYATGRGEQLEPVRVDLSSYSLQIICPGVHVSTKDAFGNIKPAPAANDLREVIQRPVLEWKGLLVNDFEVTVFAQHPELAAIKEQLYADGALYASMSGSGSAVYGLFEKGKRSGLLGSYFE
jgi:4-diphosphocytidyl-2-C-methyl-D-erythritol kinase